MNSIFSTRKNTIFRAKSHQYGILSNFLKQEILSHIQRISADTPWGAGLHLFAGKEGKTDDDYLRMLQQLQSQLNDSPEVMQNILGSSYSFFQNLNIN